MPAGIAALAERLSEASGVAAVVLGGSRATGDHRPDSDWDIGVYYRGSRGGFDPAAVRRLGHPGYVSAVGEWGPIMNGGAWLSIDGLAVDVLYRDLDVVETWLASAAQGRYEVLAQNGYIVGAPTYLPVGELALCRPLVGDVPRPAFPDALASSAPERWNGRASVALMFASIYARRAEVVACAGMLSSAVLCAAHARLARRREWALNEKRLVQRAGLDGAERVLARPGAASHELTQAVERVSALLEVEPLAARGRGT